MSKRFAKFPFTIKQMSTRLTGERRKNSDFSPDIVLVGTIAMKQAIIKVIMKIRGKYELVISVAVISKKNLAKKRRIRCETGF